MSTLRDTLLDPANRSKVIDDCCQMVADEVSSKRGLTGLAVKAAFKTVRAFRPNIVESVIEALLELRRNLNFYQAFQESDSNDLNRYCVRTRVILPTRSWRLQMVGRSAAG